MNNNSIESVTTTAGLIGFIVLFCLAIACWFLFRGLNKRLRRMRFAADREASLREQKPRE
ncbi:hypothetical protein ACMYYO_12395 [Dermacoccaceae bacterium W4C1]